LEETQGNFVACHLITFVYALMIARTGKKSKYVFLFFFCFICSSVLACKIPAQSEYWRHNEAKKYPPASVAGGQANGLGFS